MWDEEEHVARTTVAPVVCVCKTLLHMHICVQYGKIFYEKTEIL